MVDIKTTLLKYYFENSRMDFSPETYIRKCTLQKSEPVSGRRGVRQPPPRPRAASVP